MVRMKQYAPFSFRQIVEFVFLLPLNFVPWVGVVLFVFATGYRAGPLLNWRYFMLRKMDRKERNEFVRRHRWLYTWYGMVYLVLQLVPVLSMLFLLTTAAGGGLLAADLEERDAAGEGYQGQAVSEEEDGVPAQEEHYEDDPV